MMAGVRVKPKWTVHKFGGSSLASAACYRHVASLILDRIESADRLAIVVSAQGSLRDENGVIVSEKITSLLLQCADLAAKRSKKYEEVLSLVYERHLDSASEILGATTESFRTFVGALNEDVEDLRHLLRSVWLGRVTDGQEWWTGYGEIWSARLLTALLSLKLGDAVDWADAREILTVTDSQCGVLPEMDVTFQRWTQWFHPRQARLKVVVICGYVCSSMKGKPATLGRDGSDYSASIFAALLGAGMVTIWTDVDGVYSADPSIVKDAVVRPEISYDEAMELAYFGAKVLHPKTMTPVLVSKIPICIRNTFRPDACGSQIHCMVPAPVRQHVIQGFSCISNLILINVEGSGLIGVPGVAKRLFGAINDAGCSVVMITQGGSEHAVCFAIPESEVSKAVPAVRREFRDEIESRDVQSIESWGPCACLAAVGDEMEKQIGIAGKFLTALGKANVNIRAIAQGASERNISVIVDQADARRALNAVHSEFIRESPIVAVGVIAGDNDLSDFVVDSFCRQETTISRGQVNLMALSSGDKMLLRSTPIGQQWKRELTENGVKADVDAMAAYLRAHYACAAVLIDCSNDAAVVANYESIIQSGTYIISANEFLALLPSAEFRSLAEESRSVSPRLYISPIAEASLPILSTGELLQTVDQITRIEIETSALEAASMCRLLVVVARYLGHDFDAASIEVVDARKGMVRGVLDFAGEAAFVDRQIAPSETGSLKVAFYTAKRSGATCLSGNSSSSSDVAGVISASLNRICRIISSKR